MQNKIQDIFMLIIYQSPCVVEFKHDLKHGMCLHFINLFNI
jgi:hypothetical protein